MEDTLLTHKRIVVIEVVGLRRKGQIGHSWFSRHLSIFIIQYDVVKM